MTVLCLASFEKMPPELDSVGGRELPYRRTDIHSLTMPR
jgi:hypothetical protein